MRRSTSNLLPLRGWDLPGVLICREEIVLRRIRVVVALTPTIRAF